MGRRAGASEVVEIRASKPIGSRGRVAILTSRNMTLNPNTLTVKDMT